MGRLPHASIILVIVLSCEARAQIEPKAKATGSISGNVTISGTPARGVKVVTLQGDRYEHKTVATARTDAKGDYQLRNIPAGTCIVSVDAPTFASDLKGVKSIAASKTIKLEEGESVEGINLEIAPGGVITGRVTETTGRPLIGETVYIVPFKEGHDDDDRYVLNDVLRAMTDDRGIYRAYGLPAGRYKVKVGDRWNGHSKPSFGRVPLPESYHPGVTDNSKAEVVEVAAASEATDIDIRINLVPEPKTKTYAIAGRIVDAQTGRALPNVRFHYQREIPYKRSLSDDAQDRLSEFGKSDSKGEFRINDLPSGKYTIDVSTSAESPWFAEKKFEVVDLDIRGLEVTVHRAGSISGIVMLENSNDAAAVAKLSQLKIGEGFMPISMRYGVQVNKDCSFRLDGLKPGIHSISLAADGNSEGFEILRVERGEVQLDKDELWRRGIKVGPGEDVTGVRVIVARYTGAVRGQIKIEGAMPTGGYLEISATPLNQPKKELSWTRSKRLAVLVNRWRRGTIDARGRFVINRLPPGEYEINLDAFITPWKDDDKNDGDDEPVTLTSVVTVPDAGEAHMDFVLDLTKTSPRKRP